MTSRVDVLVFVCICLALPNIVQGQCTAAQTQVNNPVICITGICFSLTDLSFTPVLTLDGVIDTTLTVFEDGCTAALGAGGELTVTLDGVDFCVGNIVTCVEGAVAGVDVAVGSVESVESVESVASLGSISR